MGSSMIPQSVVLTAIYFLQFGVSKYQYISFIPFAKKKQKYIFYSASLSSSIFLPRCHRASITLPPPPAAVQCDIPEDPENGKSTFTRRIYNSVVSYKCDYSYMLVGPETRRCGPDKKWSGVQPQCKRRSSSSFAVSLPSTFFFFSFCDVQHLESCCKVAASCLYFLLEYISRRNCSLHCW